MPYNLIAMSTASNLRCLWVATGEAERPLRCVWLIAIRAREATGGAPEAKEARQCA